MPWKWYDSKIIQIEEIAPNVNQYWLKIEGEERFRFRAGQFITLDLPINDKRLKRWRSYSIANHPDDTNILELCIVRNPEGDGTRFLFDEIKVGSPVRFKGPDGAFIRPEKMDQDLVMICTGTGVAPFRSMLWDIYYDQISHKNIHLIYGTRYKSGILYEEEFKELEKRLKGFTYEVTLSREEWDGPTGYVHDLYLEKYKEVKSDIKFLLCGWTDMIDDAVANLIVQLKYDKSQVLYELYG